MVRLRNPISDLRSRRRLCGPGSREAQLWQTLCTEGGKAAGQGASRASWEHVAERARLVPAGLDRNLNAWTGVFGPVPLLGHETGHRELLTGCKQLSSHTCYWIYGSALDTPIPGHDSFCEKPGSSIKHAESLAVGFSTALSPGASCTVAAAKAGLPKQAWKSAPLELAPDLPLGMLAISPRESERKFSLWFHCLENSPNSFLSSCLGRDWQHQMAAFCIISKVK